MVQCSRCGTIYEESAAYCPHCGANAPVYSQPQEYGQPPAPPQGQGYPGQQGQNMPPQPPVYAPPPVNPYSRPPQNPYYMPPPIVPPPYNGMAAGGVVPPGPPWGGNRLPSGAMTAANGWTAR